MSRSYSIDDTYIRDCIRNGYTQHVALVFPGTPFDIIGDEYVAVENGFTLNEYLNQDDDIVPGNVKSYVFTSTLLNHDSSLSGFDFARDFMLMVGVEKNNGIDMSASFGSRSNTERLLLNNIAVLLENNAITIRTSGGGNYKYLLTNCRHMFAVRGAESNATYYLFIVYDDGTTKYIGNTYRIDPGDGSSVSQVTLVRSTHIPINESMFARLEALAYNNICEVWDFNNKHNTICQRFVYDGTKTTRHDILFEHMCVLTGKQPRKTLGKIITFDAVGLSDKLNQSADSYADTAFSSSKTIKTIKTELLTAAGLTAENLSYAPENNIYFSNNPFSGMHGYTYRDFLSQIGQAIGRNLRESKRQVVCNLEDNIPVSVSIVCSFYFPNRLFISTSINTLRRTDYYTYDADEYTVNAVDLVVSKQTDTDTDVGVQYPDSPAGSNAYIVINNQILNDNDTSIVKARLSYLYASLTYAQSYGYHPIVVDMPSWLYFEPGDVISMPLDDGVEIDVPIFNVTTVWNGGADCTIECTGNKTRNQYEQKEFKKTLKEGSKIHELIVDIDRVYSEIMDTLTNDYSTTNQTATQIALYVGNHAYEIVSGIDINSSGVTITGSKYISMDTSGYINLANVALINRFGMRLKVSDDPYYMRIGATGSLGTNEVLNIGYEVLNERPSFTMRTKRSPSSYEACLNIFSAPNTNGQNYDLITIAPYEYGQLGTSNRTWTGAKSWSLIYGDTINYITLEQGSSRDIKHDIQTMPDMGSIIDSLVPVTFAYNNDPTERKRYGLIHEDTYAVFPDICSGTDYSDADKKSINYVELVPILLKEIQSLRQRVNELEQKNEQN